MWARRKKQIFHGAHASRGPLVFQALCLGAAGHVAGNMGLGVSRGQIQILRLSHNSCVTQRGCGWSPWSPSSFSASLSVRWGKW